MGKKMHTIHKGVKLRKQSSAITYSAETEGAIYNNNDSSLEAHINGANREIVTDTETQTLTNKTIGDTNTINAQDDAFSIQDASDNTIEIDFNAAGTGSTKTTITSSQTANRVITLPDATDTLVGKATTDTLTNKTLTSPVLNTGVSGTAILDEDDMATDSDTQLATQQSIKAYVDAQVTAQDLDIAGDSGTDAIDLDSETLTFTGGNGMITAASSGTSALTITADIADGAAIAAGTANKLVDASSVIDEDNMTSNSDQKVPTQQSVKAYVDTHAADTTTHGTSGDIVGTSDAQTLTNKIIGDTNTINAQDDAFTIDDAADATLQIDFNAAGTSGTKTTITGSQTANRVVTLPDATDTLVGKATTDTFTNKTFDADGTGNSITNIEDANIKAGAAIDAAKIHDASVSNTEFGYLNGVTSAIQTQLDTKTDTGTANEIALTGTTIGIADNPVIPGTDAMVLPVGTTAQGVSTTDGAIRFNSDLNRFEGYKSGAFNEIGGGAGDADTIHLLRADAIVLGDIDLTGNNADFDGGGTITASSVTLDNTAGNLLTGSTQVILYDPDADGSDDYFGFTKNIPIGQRGRELGFQFNYKTDSTTEDNDFRFCVKIKDGGNAGDISYFNMEAFNNSDNTGTVFSVGVFIPLDCTQIEFGWQNTDTTTTVQLHVDNILVTQSPFVVKDLYENTDWINYTPGSNWSTNTTHDAYYRRIGDSIEISGIGTLTGAPDAVQLTIDLPSGLTFDTAKMVDDDTDIGNMGYAMYIDSGTGRVAAGQRIYYADTNSFRIRSDNSAWSNTVPITWANGDKFAYRVVAPISGWSSSSEHVVVPRTAPKQYSEADGDFTVTGSNWTTNYAEAIYYIDQQNNHRLKGNIRGSLSSTATALTLSVSGVAFSSLQAVSTSLWAAPATFVATTKAYAENTTSIKVASASSFDNILVSFDVALDSKPTWADPVTAQYLSAIPFDWDYFTLENGVKALPTNHLHVSTDFPDTTDLYGWHINGSGDYDDGDWIGSIALTEGGAITANTNHLGTSVFNDFDGTNDYIYASDTTFDTADESFTIGGWFKSDQASANQFLFSKYEADNADKSFFGQLDTSGANNNVRFYLYYDNAGNNVNLDINADYLNDGNWHHVVCVYDQSNTSISLYIDGICFGYTIDSNLATRNNGTTSELTFSGYYDTGTGLGVPFDGKISDVFYKKDVLTANEIRKVYAAGCQKLVTEETANISGSKVSIHDGRRDNGTLVVFPTSEYTVTTSFAEVTGHKVIVSEDGKHTVTFQGSMALVDSDGTTQELRLYIYDGSAALEGTYQLNYLNLSANSDQGILPYHITFTGYFTKDTPLSLYAKMDTGNNCLIKYSNGIYEPKVELTKLD